jgi:hypothetical protein
MDYLPTRESLARHEFRGPRSDVPLPHDISERSRMQVRWPLPSAYRSRGYQFAERGRTANATPENSGSSLGPKPDASY